MSIAVLNQVYDETRRLAIAGSNLAVQDFRLKKLISPLEKSAEKAPVFGQVAKAIEKLIGATQKESAQALLDLASLVSAILYTQGQTVLEGPLEEIESCELGNQSTQVSARVMKPLIEALMTTGSGRLETVRDAYQQGAFNDLRIINLAVKALDDVYSELADFVAEKVLPQYGTAIVPLIKDSINIKGRGGDVRRLKALHQQDPGLARPIVLDAFENGSKEMKIAALACLGDTDEDLPHLHEQAKSRSKDVRRVAFERLSRFTDAATVALFTKALNSADVELVVSPISQNESPQLLKLVHDSIETQSSEFLTGKAKTKRGKELQQLSTLLTALYGRSDIKTLSIVESLFDQRAELLKLKGTPVSGSNVLEHLTEIMLNSKSKKLRKRLIESRDEFRGRDFSNSFVAAVMICKPAEVYSLFSSYYLVKGKPKGIAKERQEIIQNTFSFNADTWDYYASTISYYRFPTIKEGSGSKVKWDPKWIAAAVEQDDLESVTELATRKDKAIHAYLEKKYEQELKARQTHHHDLLMILAAMIETKHGKAVDYWIQTLQKHASKEGWYYVYYLSSLIPFFSSSAVKKIEAIIPELPETLADQILERLITLKTKKK
ncbi:DUF5691 domain-containing protein [Gimesia fumaroli]|uniref:HEAT repeat protein n=1 Tax=Gimesia fumaroli TaxID=2527976 RepID=A0A518ICG1_9PLAN|nr:DUF5691 domain-containing protein [Gimesia fumaroli]QDV50773.1 hypothetical protein Enr17x_28170 [Gimesia fumaroli]